MEKRVFTEEEVFGLELKAHSAGADAGARQERRRIIAILEEQGFEYRPLSENPNNLIAIIKGENE